MTAVGGQPGVPPSRSRRRFVYAGAGAVAALAGAAVAWRQHRPASAAADGAVAALWGLRFETPQGQMLSMDTLRGKLLLINFWATWCPPCVEELPLVESFYRANIANNWAVVALAVDQPSAVRQFLTRVPVSFPVGLAGLGGTELGKSLGNLSGGLPFTVVIGPGGEVRQRRMGRLTEAELSQWARLS